MIPLLYSPIALEVPEALKFSDRRENNGLWGVPLVAMQCNGHDLHRSLMLTRSGVGVRG